MNNQKGVTLIELLVAIVILGIIIVPTLTIMTGTATRTVSQERETSNAYVAQMSMEKIRMNEDSYKLVALSNVEDRYCVSNQAISCTGINDYDFPISNLAFRNEILAILGDNEIVEIYVIESEYEGFNEVKVVVKENSNITYGGPDVTTKENRIELVTVVKQ